MSEVTAANQFITISEPNTQSETTASPTGASGTYQATNSPAGLGNIYDFAPAEPLSFTEVLTDALYTSHSPNYTLAAKTNKDGTTTVSTADGYKIDFLAKEQGWTITGPDGRVTKIWGDPHVKESDGDTWDFTKQSSFLFGNNKVTVETTPPGANGATLSQTVTIYNGSDRFTMTDIHNDKPKLRGWKMDATSHDKNLADGDSYSLVFTADGREEWQKSAA